MRSNNQEFRDAATTIWQGKTMLMRKFIAVLTVFGMLGVANAAFAQNNATAKKSIFDRLDDFGNSIIDGIFPTKKSKTKARVTPKTKSRYSPKKSDASDSFEEIRLPRAGSILSESKTKPQASSGALANGETSLTPENSPPAVLRRKDGLPKPVRRPLASTSLLGKTNATESISQQIIVGQSREAENSQSGASSRLSDSGKSTLQPLHKRLSGFSQSVFGAHRQKNPSPQPNIHPDGTSKISAIKTPPTPEPEAHYLTGRPVVARRVAPVTSDEDVASVESPLDPEADASGMAKTLPEDTGKADGSTSPASGNSVLFTRGGPNLGVETVGPRKITVGREATYEVNLVNSGEAAAEQLVVFVSLPEWAEVAGAEVSTGAVQAAKTGQPTGIVQWNLGLINAKGRERLTLKIIPRQSRPFDLAVRWDYKPTASQALIEVQEPKLSLQIEGAQEVLYGAKEVYRLKLKNTGSGSAENVVIMLMPVGTGENVPATHKVGVLAAGEEKMLDVELVARQAGNLTIQMEAHADGGIRAELVKKVLVRRAVLKVDVDGPRVQFVGTTATYAIRVANLGTAPARNIQLSVELPAGAKYQSGVKEARRDASGNKLTWEIETLGVELEQSFELKCSLGTAGMSQIRLNASADDDITASAQANVRVEAVANLVMEVKDPPGPVPVGKEAIYQVRVRNRGTKEARGVEVFTYFSRGIEPVLAEGGPNRLGPGQVAFHPIAALAPGAEAVFSIRALAEEAGNHVFRAEAHCKPLSARLISEATSLYYADGPAPQQAKRTPSDRESAAAQYDAMRPVTQSLHDKSSPVSTRK